MISSAKARVPVPAATGDIAPTRYSFSVTDTARKLLTREQVRGALFIEMQSDPDNTLDILIDTQQAVDRPLQLAPADVRVLDLPAEIFSPGERHRAEGGRLPLELVQARRRSFVFDVWAKLASGSTAQTLVVWIWKEA